MSTIKEDTLDDNFGIISSTEYGTGSPELLEGLFASETSTEDPDKIVPIVKEVEDVKDKVPEVKRGKEIVPKPDGEELTNQDLLTNFLAEEESDNDDGEETHTDPIVKDKETTTETDDNPFTTLHKELLELNVFTKDDEDGEEELVKTPEEFLARFNLEKKKGASEIMDRFISQFGEDYQNAFQAIYVKGVDPKEYFSTYNTITDFATLDITKEENQIAIMRQSLTDEGLEPDDIKDEIEKLQNYGDLESAATKRHKILIRKSALKLQELEQKSEQELKQKAEIKNQFINNVRKTIDEKLKTKEYDGIPLNPKLAQELHDFLLVDGWVTPSGEKLTGFDKAILDLKRPENHALKVKVALLLKIMEKDPNLSTIQKAGVTKKSEELFKQTVGSVKKVKTSSTEPQSRSWSF
jgi:hypothetical protein